MDYAIEFKNYGFIRFLIENGYITLISDNKGYVDFNFGASTTLKVRPYEAKTFQNELYENKILRTQIISLALENNDYDVLYEMRAREFPPQLTMVTHSVTSVKFSEYYDENFIDAILDSKVKAIQYFCEEYYVESKWQKEQFLSATEHRFFRQDKYIFILRPTFRATDAFCEWRADDKEHDCAVNNRIYLCGHV